MNNRNTIAIVLVIVAIVALAMFRSHMPSLVGSDSSTKPISTPVYACNAGKTIQAAFYAATSTVAVKPGEMPIPGGSAVVTLNDGTSLTLHQTISADGARYANADESFVFWSKGNGALVLENNVQKNYIGCISVKQDAGLPEVYSNSSEGFSLRYPAGYVPTSSYIYQALGPGKGIAGVKFTIPATAAQGTNLSSDSYVSVEEVPRATTCSAALFVPVGTRVLSYTENGTEYSIATSSDAGAGNRYEETVYAMPGTNPCVAMRYFIHYGVYENYPEGSITQFDRESLLGTFDRIRRTLTIVQ